MSGDKNFFARCHRVEQSPQFIPGIEDADLSHDNPHKPGAVRLIINMPGNSFLRQRRVKAVWFSMNDWRRASFNVSAISV
jgi:hypothetical protein